MPVTYTKLYILDTNVLVYDPKALFNFEGATVGIPLTVIEELDHFKGENSQRGFSAREAIRLIDKLRAYGSLKEGVQLEHKGTLQVLIYDAQAAGAYSFGSDEPDNRILNIALAAHKSGREVEFITKDLNMRVKADAIGLKAVDYKKDIVSVDEFYRGWSRLQVPAVQLKHDMPRDLLDYAHEIHLIPNQYVIVESQHNEHNYRVFRSLGGTEFTPVRTPHLKWSFEPRNVQQIMALDLLLNDEIPIVSLTGPAGTGKTLLVLIAALYKVMIEEIYTNLLVSRPIIPLGPDLGYLPGELQDKLYNWMQPIYDNMELIAHIAGNKIVNPFGPLPIIPLQEEHTSHKQSREQHKKHTKKKHAPEENGNEQKKQKGYGHALKVEHLVQQGKLSLEAITYMRGRSIPYRFVFIDEVQNLTPHEVKTIVSRVGDGSKIVLAGDPYQIDSPYLDFSSNGLMVLAERFKGQKLFGTVYLEKSERSELSKLAGELL